MLPLKVLIYHLLIFQDEDLRVTGLATIAAIPSRCLHVIMHLTMLSPRGGGPRASVGHLTFIVFPTLRNLTKNLGPRVGTCAFFARRNGTKSQRPM